MRYQITNKIALQQLGELTSNDIAPKIKKKKSANYYIFNGLRVVIFMVCLVVFLFSVKNIADNFASYDESSDYYEGIKDLFENQSGLTNSNLVSSSNPVPLKGFEAMLEGKGEVAPPVSNDNLQKIIETQNMLLGMKGEIPDIYGWIKIPGTNIDYPVVQGNDNQYYVNYAANKVKNVAGAIFVDFRQKNPPHKTQNLVIYGHNIRTWGTMFNGLVNYLYEDFFLTHPTIKLDTKDGIYEYTVFSVCETDIYSNYADIYFSTQEDFELFCNDTLARALYTREGVTINKDSKLLTLSTCSNSFNGTKRYVVVGVLNKMIVVD